MLAMDDFNQYMRTTVIQEQSLFEQRLARDLISQVVDSTMAAFARNGTLHQEPTSQWNSEFVASVSPRLGEYLVESPDANAVGEIVAELRRQLVSQKFILDGAGPAERPEGMTAAVLRITRETVGFPQPTFEDEVAADVDRERMARWQTFVTELNWRLFDQATSMYTHLAIDRIQAKAGELQLAIRSPTREETQSLQATLSSEFARRLMLWRRDIASLKYELNSVVRMPGWANIWTQPIINRINMLATGVNTSLGVRVFGDDMQQIAAKCQEIADVLRPLRGATDVSADQVVGEGYLEIDIDRGRARAIWSQHRRYPRCHRNRFGRPRDYDNCRRTRAISGTHSICSRIPRGRGIRQEPAGHRVRDVSHSIVKPQRTVDRWSHGQLAL